MLKEDATRVKDEEITAAARKIYIHDLVADP